MSAFFRRLHRRSVALVVLVLVAVPTLSGCLITHIIRNRLPEPHPVEGGILFQFEAPSARYVNLAGNFNDWCGTATIGRFDPTIDPMSDDDGDGIWTIVKPLRPGRYQYQFVTDNGVRWERDPNNTGTDQEGGFENSLLIVR